MRPRWQCAIALNQSVCGFRLQSNTFYLFQLTLQWKEQPPGEAEVAMRESLPAGPSSPRLRAGKTDDDLFSAGKHCLLPYSHTTAKLKPHICSPCGIVQCSQ